jgi:predicted HTH domain antitoxin
MNISINVPDDLEQELKAAFGPDLSQSAWEALIVEGYRTRKLGIGQVMRLLKLESRFHAEEWLASHHVAANYSADDLELDRQNLNALFGN